MLTPEEWIESEFCEKTSPNTANFTTYGIEAIQEDALLYPGARFKIGDQVQKLKGYKYPGEVRSVLTTKSGEVKYVVECTVSECVGMLHIYNESQLDIKP